MLIRIPEIEKVRAHIGPGGQYVDFNIGRMSVWVDFEPDRITDQNQRNKSKKEKITLDSSTTSSAEVYGGDSEEDMVVV